MDNKRRDFFKKSAIVTAGTAALASNAFSANINKNKKVRLKLATSWPANFPIMGTGIERFAKRVKLLSGGSIKIKVYPKNVLVPALSVFDACSAGNIDAFHSGPYYWKGKNEAFSLFSGFPFGMIAQELNAWFDFGGGMDLWRELYAKYNLVPFKGGNTTTQMGGWFRKPIKTLSDLKGLKMRIPGLGGEVLAKLGVSPTLLPAGEIYVALERGTIDATEWVGPALDIKMGFQKVAKHYYTGWHEPGSVLEVTFNKKKFDSLSKEQQLIIETASEETNAKMAAEFQAENAKALKNLPKDVKIERWPQDIVEAAKKALLEVAKEKSAKSPDFKRVWDSASSFLDLNRPWTDTGLKSYLQTR